MKDRIVNRITIKFAIMLIVAVVLLFTGLGTATTIILNRLGPPPAAASAVPQHTSMVLAGELQRPYSCRLYDDEHRKCAFGSCDRRTLDRLERECLRDGGRP